MKMNAIKIGGIFFYLLVIAVFPLVVNNRYYLTIAVFAGFHALIVLGLNLLMGYAGQISLGQAAFYGLGAYGSAILTARYLVPPALALVLAALITGGIALVIGIPSLRLRGHYLAMATLGFGIIIYIIFNELDWMTGGPSGFIGIPPLKLGRIILQSQVQYYFLTWGLVSFIILILRNLVYSRIGRALRALHFSELATQGVGVNTLRHKLEVFVLSAICASIAGSLYAHYLSFISPGSFGFHFSIELVTMVVLGGLGSIWGSLSGAVILTLLPEVLRPVKDYEIIVYGIILILAMIFLPDGILRGLGNYLPKNLKWN
jgi:branched-chain amino acid transport system permease protein